MSSDSCDLCDHEDSPFYYQDCPDCARNDPKFIQAQIDYQNELAQGTNRKKMTADIRILYENQKTMATDILKLVENQNKMISIIWLFLGCIFAFLAFKVTIYVYR